MSETTGARSPENDAADHDAYISLTTPREFTQHGGWSVACGCGVALGDTGNEAAWQSAHEEHLTSVIPPEVTP